MRTIEKDLKEINHNPNCETDNALRTHEAYLASQLKQLKKKQIKNKKDILNARLANHGEKMGGMWSALGKVKQPRNPIYRLKIPKSNPVKFECNSKKMAELARNHHENLQNEDINPNENQDEYNRKLNNLLERIPEEQRLREPERTRMNERITEEQVSKALRAAKDGSTTGLDGCPYELWKALEKRHNKRRNRSEPSFDIIKAITYLYRDIQENRLENGSEFNSGWMCPIFKKKDPTDICNYCPITLLNTDYKLLTKTLAIQLIDHVHKLIHLDQAGFIPNQLFFNLFFFFFFF